MNKADRVRKHGNKPTGLRAVLWNIEDQPGDRDFLSFRFKLDNGDEVTRESPALLSDHSVTWQLIAGILGTNLTLEYRQWIKAKNLKNLIGRPVLIRLAQKADRNGKTFQYVEEVFPAT